MPIESDNPVAQVCKPYGVIKASTSSYSNIRLNIADAIRVIPRLEADPALSRSSRVDLKSLKAKGWDPAGQLRELDAMSKLVGGEEFKGLRYFGE